MFSHKSHSAVFKRWCIVLSVAVFIFGIVAGFVFKTQEVSYSTSYYYSTPHSESHFNWGLMFMIWLAYVIPVAILYAVYSHLENQEIQINILNEIRKTMTEPQKMPVVTNQSVTYKRLDEQDNTTICTMCGAKNPIGAQRCSKCNAML